MKKYWSKEIGLIYLFTIIVCFIISFYIKEADVKIATTLSDYNGSLKLYYSYGKAFSEKNSAYFQEELKNNQSNFDIHFLDLKDNTEHQNETISAKIETVRIDFEECEINTKFTIKENAIQKGIVIWQIPLETTNTHDMSFAYNNGNAEVKITGNDPYILVSVKKIYNTYVFLRLIMVLLLSNFLFGAGWYLLVFRKDSRKVKFIKFIVSVCLVMTCGVMLFSMEVNQKLLFDTDGYLGTLKIYLYKDGYSEQNTIMPENICKINNINTHLSIYERSFIFMFPETTEYRVDFEATDESKAFKINNIGYGNSFIKKNKLISLFKDSIIGTNDLAIEWKKDIPVITITGNDPYLLIKNTSFLSELKKWSKKLEIGICSIFLILIFITFIFPERFIVSITKFLHTGIARVKLEPKHYLLEVGSLLLLVGTLFWGKEYGYIFNYLRLSMEITNQLWLLGIIVFVFLIIKRKLDKNITPNYINTIKVEKNKNIIVLGILVLIFLTVVYTYRLGVENFHNDEHYHVLAAIGYLKTGNFIQWDMVNNVPWEEYTRGWPYTWLIAQSFKLFGVSEVSARLVSVLCGLIFAAIFYKMMNKLTNNMYFSAICTLLLGIHPNLIDIFRTVRMYSLMMVCGLLLFIYIYRTLYYGNNFKTHNKVSDWITANFDFNIGYALLSLLLIGFTYLIMPNPLIMLLGIFMFIVLQYIKSKETKYFFTLLLVALTGIVFIVARIMPDAFPDIISTAVNAFFIHTTNATGYEQTIHLQYFWAVIAYPGGLILGTFFFLLGSAVLVKNKELQFFVKYMFSVIFCTFLFFVFFAHRYFQTRYMIFLLPMVFFLIAIGYYAVYSKLHAKGKIILNLLLAILIINISSYTFGYLYDHKNDNAIFSEAYAELADYWGSDNLLPLYSYHYRSEYLQQFKQVAFQAYVEDEIDNLVVFAEKYPNGVISIETQKYYMQSNDMKNFTTNFLNHFAGTGRDDNWVELYEYNFIESCEQAKGVLYDNSFKNILYFTDEKNPEGKDILKIKINSVNLINAVLENSLNEEIYMADDMVFAAVKFFGEGKELHYQLMLDENEKYLYYEIPMEISKVDINPEIFVYLGNHSYEVLCMEEDLETP